MTVVVEEDEDEEDGGGVDSGIPWHFQQQGEVLVVGTGMYM